MTELESKTLEAFKSMAEAAQIYAENPKLCCDEEFNELAKKAFDAIDECVNHLTGFIIACKHDFDFGRPTEYVGVYKHTCKKCGATETFEKDYD